MIVFRFKLFFLAYDNVNGNELWMSDGTQAGTTMCRDINPWGDSNMYDPLVYGNLLIFIADDGMHGFELWKLW